MTDLLALEIGTNMADKPSPDVAVVKPRLGATVPARQRVARAHLTLNDTAASLSVSAVIESRLRIVAPDLLARTSPATRARFVDLISKCLGTLIGNAMTVFRNHVGELAAVLDPEERNKLQDFALTARLDADNLVPRAVKALSPSELAANLADACEAHSPEGLDALRWRDVVYGGGRLLAREAMLDLVCSGQTDRSRLIFERLVSTTMIAQLEQSSSLTSETIDRLRGRCLGTGVPDAQADTRARQGAEPSILLRPTATGEYPVTGPEMPWQCRSLDRSQRVFAD